MEIHELDVTVRDDHYVYGLDGLKIKTDTWDRRGADSVLGIGDSRRGNAPLLMNYMLNHPEIVRGKRVFEPFAGAGPNGLVAAYLGATACDLLDLNPRAARFHARERRDERPRSDEVSGRRGRHRRLRSCREPMI